MALNWATITDIMCYLDTRQQSRCEKTCRVVRTLFSSGFIDSVDSYNNCRITNNILKQPKYSKLKHIVSGYVSDVGVSHLSLHTLDAFYNKKITDAFVRRMSLHTLYACCNEKITDESVRRMSLHTLYALSNEKITFEVVRGVKKMKI